MTFKLLVADDEYWVREKLRCILDWARYDIEFLEPACDGEEALAIIEAEKPDILITDMDMPGLNGVDLLEKLAQEHSQMVTLVLSGYDTFDYVKRSMRSGAINYLLKPISKLDMISAISEALDILHSQQIQSEETARQQTQMQRASSLLQDREMSLLLDKQTVDAVQTLSMNVPLNISGYRVVLLKVHDMSCAMDSYRQDINGLSYHVKTSLRGLPGKESLLIFNHFSKSNEFVLLADSPEYCTREAAAQYCRCMEDIFHSPITAILSFQSYPMHQIRSGYLWAVSQMNKRRYYPCTQIITPDIPNPVDEVTLEWSAEMRQQLGVFLKSGNRKKNAQLLLEHTGLNQSVKKSVSYGNVVHLVNRMNHTLQCGQPFTMASEDSLAISSLAEEAIHCLETLDYGQFCELEHMLIDAVLNCCQEEQSNSMKEIVEKVRNDISTHYYESFTLTALSKKYLVESSYLSRCFKSETGENLMMYLARCRIQKAVELIHENQVGLTEVSFLVGYDDYTYFSRVFKKIMGISPRDYKNQFLAKKEGASV